MTRALVTKVIVLALALAFALVPSPVEGPAPESPGSPAVPVPCGHPGATRAGVVDLTVSDVSYEDPAAAGGPVKVGVTITDLGDTAVRATQLTDSPYHEMNPSWDPAVSTVVYTGYPMEYGAFTSELFLLDPASGETTQLTNNSVGDDSPNWSPDGETIVFGRALDVWSTSIWTIPAAGGEEVSVLPHVNDQYSLWPVYSPDGSKIAYMKQETGADPFGLFVMDADGNGSVNLVAGLGDHNRAWWGPGDGHIYYSNLVSPENGGWDIWRVPQDGGGPERLTEEASANVKDPTFPAAGGYMAFQYGEFGENAPGGNSIRLMDPSSGQVLRLTNDTSSRIQPSFAPDGMSIIYSSKEDGGEYFDLWRLDATCRARLTVYDGEPDSGGTLVHEGTTPVWGGLSGTGRAATVEFDWTPQDGSRGLVCVVEALDVEDSRVENDRLEAAYSPGGGTGESPELESLNVEDGRTFPEGANFTIRAVVHDPEDGYLENGSVVWRVDGEYAGTGTDYNIRDLGPGGHTLEVTATDSDGNRLVHSVGIVIGEEEDDGGGARDRDGVLFGVALVLVAVAILFGLYLAAGKKKTPLKGGKPGPAEDAKGGGEGKDGQEGKDGRDRLMCDVRLRIKDHILASLEKGNAVRDYQDLQGRADLGEKDRRRLFDERAFSVSERPEKDILRSVRRRWKNSGDEGECGYSLGTDAKIIRNALRELVATGVLMAHPGDDGGRANGGNGRDGRERRYRFSYFGLKGHMAALDADQLILTSLMLRRASEVEGDQVLTFRTRNPLFVQMKKNMISRNREYFDSKFDELLDHGLVEFRNGEYSFSQEVFEGFAGRRAQENGSPPNGR